MANLCKEKGLSKEGAWLPFESMQRWLDDKQEPEPDPSLYVAAPDVSQQSLMQARDAAVGEVMGEQENSTYP